MTPSIVPDDGARSCLQHRLARVAHAGGGYHGRTYTNSLEALDANADAYSIFEMDFVWTSDRELVCIHDWEACAIDTFGRAFNPPPSLKEFNALVEANELYTNCTAYSLFAWLDAHPGVRIVTDVKENNVEAMSYVATRYPHFTDRFIPQIYEPSEYRPVKDLGYKDLIWTLYTFAGTDDEVLAVAPTMNLYAVAMPMERAHRQLGLRLARQGLASYVHTVNDPIDIDTFKQLGITEIYTDWLPLSTSTMP